MLPYIYTKKRVDAMWNAIAYNNCRKFAFLTTHSRWIHADKYFDNAAELYNFIVKNKVTDVHVKPLDDGGGREWIVDADYKDFKDEEDLMLKITIGATAFLLFYTEENVSRIMFSGNRGFHLWLRFTDKFKITSSQNVRVHRYQAFVKPTKLLNVNNLRPGSFAYAVLQAVQLYMDKIPTHNKLNISNDSGNNNSSSNSSDDYLAKLILLYWPDVDKDIFCNANKQIRAPFSYNYKGVKFSRCITKEILEKIKQCYPGCGIGGGGPTTIATHNQ
ncbi:lef1 [Catopsilia pomona nucleopolyhedrovirus]|uniref:Lef1 n=1 Tax=Catopsilia pomona nucleopolyhedrovirus TaxID=1850906 RepID=A0A172WZK2_9ABAC|nr:lef1 [Catopsilia pomona nucleopolyhedrovirus]ANF29772.1 lef1 [Catopsilia pomona nucleopolyhedrovirus]